MRRLSDQPGIDRPIRPLFPKDMRNDVSIVCTVMSVDLDCSPEIAAMVGTSIALSISDIPGMARFPARPWAWWTASMSSIPQRAEKGQSHGGDRCLYRQPHIAMIEAGRGCYNR